MARGAKNTNDCGGRQQPRSRLAFVPAKTALLSCLFFCVSGCLVDFAEKGDPQAQNDTSTDEGTDSRDSGTDDKGTADDGSTGGAPDTASGDSQGTSDDWDSGDHDTGEDTVTQRPSCPSGIDFSSKTVFTDLIESNSTVVDEYRDSCPDGQVIVGYQGFLRDETGKNLVHGKIQALCATPSVHSEDGACVVRTGKTTPLPLRGNAGNREWTRMCPEGEMIAGYQGTTGADIDRIFFACAPLIITLNGKVYTITRGPLKQLEQAGGDGGNYVYQDDCPDGQIATSSVTHTSNIFVSALGMGCQSPSLLY